jgi:starch phosphorylase
LTLCQLAAATSRDRFEAAARSVRDVLSQRWILTEQTYERQNAKRLYYVSMEFLIGRTLANNISNLLLEPLAQQLLEEKGIDRTELLEQEPDAGLGNGGWAGWPPALWNPPPHCSCPQWDTDFDTSTAYLSNPSAMGGSRKQPDNCFVCRPLGVARPDEKVEVPLNCSFELSSGSLRAIPGRPSTLVGIPYDRPVVGYGGSNITRFVSGPRTHQIISISKIQPRRFCGGPGAEHLC